ncbi:hypothetical protein BH23CHL5_BH23CHL5_25380 [soil metagenome]
MPDRPEDQSDTNAIQIVHRPWKTWGLTAAFALFVFLFSAWDSWSELRASPFHPDESRWINRAYYLGELRDPFGSAWADRYLIRGQPPMGSYVTGLGLVLQGRDQDTNGAWDFQFGFESNVTWNVTRGNMPAEGDLIAARRTALILGALTCTALFLIVATITNIAGGVAAGVFLAVNPLHQYLATLATSDAAFTFFVALSVLTAMWLSMKPTWWRGLLFATAMAAGASTKLSPLALAFGIGLFGVVLLFDPWLRRLPHLGREWRLLSRVESGSERELGWRLLVQPVAVALLFVISYPYLWSAPIGRTRNLFDFRRFEMDNQAGFWPQAAVQTRADALRRTWENLNDRYSSTGRVLGGIGERLGLDPSSTRIDLYLAVPGIAILVYLAWRNGLSSPHAMVAVTIGGQSLLILLALGVDFNRYYLPLLLAAALGVGVLAGWITGSLWAWTCSIVNPRLAGVFDSSESPPNAIQVADS